MATIRAGRIGDEETLAGLNRLVQDLHLQHRPDQFRATKLSELTAWYKTLLGSANARCWIAEDQSAPIGYLLATFQQAPENPFIQARAWCELVEMAVDPNYRRLGTARTLILHAIAAAREKGIDRIEATSWSFNEGAHEMLRRLGFVSKIVRFERSAN
jgi:GNAT superfamily N-acetyltransferase